MENIKMNTQEALAHYNLNFDVAKAPVFSIVNGETVEVPNVFSMVRQDTGHVLPGVSVSKSYEIVQTRSYADIIERVTGELDAEFVKGGVLKDGRLTYLQCKLPGTIRVKGTGDAVDKYLTFVNSFDGSSRFMILPTLLRIFCSNQMSALTREARASGLRFSHTRSVQERLKQADQAILDAMNAYRAFEQKIDWLADTRFTEAQMELATRRLLKVKDETKVEDISTRTKNNIGKVLDLFDNGTGVAQWRGTAWAAYNAMTEYAKDCGRESTDKFESNLIGSNSKIIERAITSIESVVAA